MYPYKKEEMMYESGVVAVASEIDRPYETRAIKCLKIPEAGNPVVGAAHRQDLGWVRFRWRLWRSVWCWDKSYRLHVCGRVREHSSHISLRARVD